jgi:hypothetical protein
MKNKIISIVCVLATMTLWTLMILAHVHPLQRMFFLFMAGVPSGVMLWQAWVEDQ